MSDRREELKKVLKQGGIDTGPTKSGLTRGPTFGKGKLKTRINWGFWVLLGAFLLFIVTWFVLRPMGVFG